MLRILCFTKVITLVLEFMMTMMYDNDESYLYIHLKQTRVQGMRTVLILSYK